MDRTACVDLPAFPLQLLLRRHADWRDAPAAVVGEDRPQGTILWVNEAARERRVLPGMRYAAGLALAPGLRAAAVPGSDVEQAVATLARRLRRYTPGVEPAASEPGVFWLDASGLEGLWPSLRDWAGLVRSEIEEAGFGAAVVVGFGRFGTYALARAGRGVLVLDRPEDERAASRRVPLDRLALEPEARDALAKLGVATVGRFADLPVEGIGRRFGPGALRLHRLASGELRLPVQAERPPPPAVERLALDHAETSAERLLAAIERLLRPLLETLAGRAHAVAGLKVGLHFERLGDHVETIRPAEPTLDAKQLLDLVRLRLEAVRRLPDGVSDVALLAEETAASAEQIRLLGRTRRDLAAANRALARVRAEFGDGAVVRARLREGHLPEARFAWEALDGLAEPHPRREGAGRLVRRIHDRPLALPPRPRQEPDGWMLRGLEQGPVVRVAGPYVVSGGWWRRAVHREYHFAETQKGELLWVYYDRLRRRWFVQGRVE